MTSIVGILNKQAVAVAADSAVTVNGGAKIYNTANKIFNLSKGCPVGIAIYGNAALNGCVPWEVVIKMYRKHIGDKKFATLSEYAQHFFEYVQSYTQQYISDEDALSILEGNILQFWCEEFTRGLREGDGLDAPIAKLALSILKDKVNAFATKLKKHKVLEAYKDVKIDAFVAAIQDVLDIIKQQITKNGGKWEEYEAPICEILYRMFTTTALNNPNTSGVSIFGFGENEIYPSLQEYLVYNIVLGVQRIDKKPDCVINESKRASIYAMAQRDVIETFVEGVSKTIKNTFLDATESAIKETVKGVSSVIKPYDANLADAIKAMDSRGIVQQYRNTINEIIQRDQVSPLIRTIASMGKEDIADLAENLIYMTSMKRHVTPFAETVGGPIDVAIISKGDGFIWMKRKHYFSADLNRTFFDIQR